MGGDSPQTMAESDLSDEAQAIQTIMDSGESELADRWKQIAIEHKKAFKSFIRDNPNLSADTFSDLKARLRNRFRPKYRKAAQEVGREMRKQAAQVAVEQNDTLRKLLGEDWEPPVKNEPTQDSLEITLTEVADEIFNRNQGWLSEQTAERTRQQTDDGEQTRKDIDRIDDSTIEDTAGKASGAAVNQGREDALDEAKEKGTAEKVKATRNAVLDKNTCQPCRDLDGETCEYKSKKYHEIRPPAACNGGHKCRCWMEIDWPDSEFDQDEIPFSDSEHPTEPIKLSDDGQWVRIFSWGKVDHPQGEFEVDGQFAREMVDSFDYLRERYDYKPPILRQHREDGYRYGQALDLDVRGDGIYAKLSWIPSAKEAVEKGKIDYLSPSFFEQWEDPHSGQTLRHVLHEVSFVSVGHLKNIQSISDQPQTELSATYYQLESGGNSMPDDEKQNESDDQEKEMASGLKSPIAKLIQSRLEALPEKSQGRLPGRKEILSDLKDQVDGAQALMDGKITFPTDEQMEAIAETFGLDMAKLRRGAVEGMKGKDKPEDADKAEKPEQPDKPEGEKMPDGQTADQPVENSADREIDCGHQAEIKRLKKEVARYELQAQVPGIDEDKVDRLVDLKAADEEAFSAAVEVLKEGPQSVENDDQSEDARISSPGQPPSGGTQLRSIYEEAKENGVERGPDLIKFVQNKGHTHNRDLADKVYQ